MNKILFSIISCVVCLFLTSCDFFTTSFAKDLVRPADEMFKEANTADLVDLAKDAASTNPDVAAGIMNELANRPDELKDLDIKDREEILGLAVDATLPMSAITGALENIDLENMENMTEEDTVAIIDSVFENIAEFDTGALQTLLADPNTLETADTSTLADAAIVSLVQTVGSDGIKNLMDNAGSINTTGTVDDVVNSIAVATGVDDSKKGDLQTTAKVIQLLMGQDGVTARDSEELAGTKILGLISLSDFGF